MLCYIILCYPNLYSPEECRPSSGSHSQRFYRSARSTGSLVRLLREKQMMKMCVSPQVDYLRASGPTRRWLTVDKVLLLRGYDADQVGVQVPAALLGPQPRLPLQEVQVTVALEFCPSLLALLLICQQPQLQSVSPHQTLGMTTQGAEKGSHFGSICILPYGSLHNNMNNHTNSNIHDIMSNN